mmetsp:Transcript_43227/g.124795  ORF Transcript_43227/g.124795 Transcript_43227/m.124795 type:complete len:228 (-) Transcript_43227:15-698(-)
MPTCVCPLKLVPHVILCHVEQLTVNSVRQLVHGSDYALVLDNVRIFREDTQQPIARPRIMRTIRWVSGVPWPHPTIASLAIQNCRHIVANYFKQARVLELRSQRYDAVQPVRHGFQAVASGEGCGAPHPLRPVEVEVLQVPAKTLCLDALLHQEPPTWLHMRDVQPLILLWPEWASLSSRVLLKSGILQHLLRACEPWGVPMHRGNEQKGESQQDGTRRNHCGHPRV